MNTWICSKNLQKFSRKKFEFCGFGYCSSFSKLGHVVNLDDWDLLHLKKSKKLNISDKFRLFSAKSLKFHRIVTENLLYFNLYEGWCRVIGEYWITRKLYKNLTFGIYYYLDKPEGTQLCKQNDWLIDLFGLEKDLTKGGVSRSLGRAPENLSRNTNTKYSSLTHVWNQCPHSLLSLFFQFQALKSDPCGQCCYSTVKKLICAVRVRVFE